MILTREEMLAEMGIKPIWTLRPVAAQASPPSAQIAENRSEAPSLPQAPATLPKMAATKGANSPTPAAAAGFVTAALPPIEAADWPTLAHAVADCRACPLGAERRQAVLGVGDVRPDWLFIGEGPGAEEDRIGEPFVGQAGKLLDAMLASLDLARGNKVYIANAVKCRPPANRTPEAQEIATCRPYLLRQIALLQPGIIVLLGKPAAASVLGYDGPLAGARGRRHDFQGIPVVVTYHPAYLLRNLTEKAKAWEDLLFARRLLRAG